MNALVSAGALAVALVWTPALADEATLQLSLIHI